MPQLNHKQNQSPTATSIKENKAFRDRLRDRYQPAQYVRVINIDNEPFTWQFFPGPASGVAGEEEFFDDGGRTRHIDGRARFDSKYETKLPGNEQMWMINPGESEVIIGENADLMIEGLYKRLVAKKKIGERPDIEKTQARSFNWNDGLMQEQMIDKIFLGIEQPNFNESRTSQAGKTK